MDRYILQFGFDVCYCLQFHMVFRRPLSVQHDNKPANVIPVKLILCCQELHTKTYRPRRNAYLLISLVRVIRNFMDMLYSLNSNWKFVSYKIFSYIIQCLRPKCFLIDNIDKNYFKRDALGLQFLFT